MTKEEALLRPVFCSKEVRDLVIEIFEDISKENCQNCKYDNTNYQFCLAEVGRPMTEYTEDEEVYLRVDKTFGCNYFKGCVH